MKSLIAVLMIVSTSAFATTMGPEAVEMVGVLTHPDVARCASEFNASQMINVKVEKTVYRCPGCNTYKISGTELNIDIPGQTKVLTAFGKAVPGFGGGFVQTYTCSLE